LAEQVIRNRIRFRKVLGSASTADGRKQDVVGRLKAIVQYDDVVKELDLHIIPSLSQELYLGIDFWKAFDLLPPDMNIAELADKSHALSDQQSNELKAVINKFPSFAISGLGIS